MTLKPTAANAKLISKFPYQMALIILLGAVSLLFGIIIKSKYDSEKFQTKRIEHLELSIKNSEVDKAEWLRIQTAKSDAQLNRQQILIDSLQKLILNRTDKNYEELKDILNIRGGNSVITIKPKNK